LLPVNVLEFSEGFLAEPLIDQLAQPFYPWVSFFKMDDCGLVVERLGKRERFQLIVNINGSAENTKPVIIFERSLYSGVLSFKSLNFIAVAKVAPLSLV
jgi:hypothetical protein